jgi:hypothetical protein
MGKYLVMLVVLAVVVVLLLRQSRGVDKKGPQ